MIDKIKIEVLKDFIQSGNINFLIGSGLSRPFLPVLGNIEKQMASVKDAPANKQDALSAVLYKEYFEKVILPNLKPDYRSINYTLTHNNYCEFLNVWNDILHNRCSSLRSKQANIFSTNIDLFVENAAEATGVEFNDGFIGSINPVFSEANFQKSVLKNSIHFQNSTELPIFNLLKVHGSINWKEIDDKVCNDFNLSLVSDIKQVLSSKVGTFPVYKPVNDDIIEQLNGKHNFNAFIDAYNKMLLVNPTKKKFSETVFDVHFYELMRLMSNNLEKENSLLFAMGFSFEDEHIRNIVKRALKTNPTLMVFIFSHKDSGKQRYLELFGETNTNLLIIAPSEFNKINSLSGDKEIKEFDFQSINSVFKNILSQIPPHFVYGK